MTLRELNLAIGAAIDPGNYLVLIGACLLVWLVAVRLRGEPAATGILVFSLPFALIWVTAAALTLIQMPPIKIPFAEVLGAAVLFLVCAHAAARALAAPAGLRHAAFVAAALVVAHSLHVRIVGLLMIQE